MPIIECCCACPRCYKIFASGSGTSWYVANSDADRNNWYGLSASIQTLISDGVPFMRLTAGSSVYESTKVTCPDIADWAHKSGPDVVTDIVAGPCPCGMCQNDGDPIPSTYLCTLTGYVNSTTCLDDGTYCTKIIGGTYNGTFCLKPAFLNDWCAWEAVLPDPPMLGYYPTGSECSGSPLFTRALYRKIRFGLFRGSPGVVYVRELFLSSVTSTNDWAAPLRNPIYHQQITNPEDAAVINCTNTYSWSGSYGSGAAVLTPNGC